MEAGEGIVNPLQCSCLENPRDRGARWAAVYGVAQSRTRLKRLSSSRTWKQPRCPSTDEWIKKLWYIYTTEYSVQFIRSVVSDSLRPHESQHARPPYYSAIKRNAFESVLMRWMNLEPIIQSEVSQKEKDIVL